MTPDKSRNIADSICAKHQDAVYRVAVEEGMPAGSNTYTYGALDYLSDKFARVLGEAGVGKGDVIAVALAPSASFLVAHFGALKRAAIILPISVSTNSDNFRQLVKEYEIKILVVDESRLADFDSHLTTTYVVTDMVSKIDFGNACKGFWYDINFAEIEVSPMHLASEDPVYFFLPSITVPLKRVTHDEVWDSLSLDVGDGELETREGRQLRISGDWSRQENLLTQLLPALYKGRTVIVT